MSKFLGPGRGEVTTEVPGEPGEIVVIGDDGTAVFTVPLVSNVGLLLVNDFGFMVFRGVING